MCVSQHSAKDTHVAACVKTLCDFWLDCVCKWLVRKPRLLLRCTKGFYQGQLGAQLGFLLSMFPSPQ